MRLLEALRAGRCLPIVWLPLRVNGVDIEVMADALKLEDGLRPSTTPVEAQLVADELDACLLTPRIADALWLAADLKLEPQTQKVRLDKKGKPLPEPHVCPGCGAQDRGPWWLCQPCGEREHSRAIDAEVARLLEGKPMAEAMLVGNVGKPWVLSKSCLVSRGMIGQPYGWYVARGYSAAVTPRLRVIQGCRLGGLPAPHGGDQLDYAEPLRLWRPPRDGQRGAKRLLIAGQLTHEGPLPTCRLPGVNP